MHVASLELCKELYELSGWGDELVDGTSMAKNPRKSLAWTPWKRNIPEKTDWHVRERGSSYGLEPGVLMIPAYDLGYLLRKLPKVQMSTGSAYKYLLTLEHTHSLWNAGYPFNGDFTLFCFGVDDTPENATCKLAIELWKQGGLK